MDEVKKERQKFEGVKAGKKRIAKKKKEKNTKTVYKNI